jgi:ABC-type phosphate/phosphonate transport system substrate-binding protein
MTTLVLGAVAYDPKVVTIWDGFRSWLRDSGFDLDYVLYSNYERQVEELLADRIDVAWNSPLAWVRARRLAAARGATVEPVLMRDTDRDLVSVVVVRRDSAVRSVEDLAGRTVGVGAIDSPQATLLPLSYLRSTTTAPAAAPKVRRFDIGVGLHGDHLGGERQAASALVAGEIDAACLTDSNLLLFGKEGTIPPDAVRVIGQTACYDHCTMTTAPTAPPDEVAEFVKLLLEMSYEDERVRPLLDMEGLTQWLPGRVSGYAALERAVDESGFYTQDGQIGVADYRP